MTSSVSVPRVLTCDHEVFLRVPIGEFRARCVCNWTMFRSTKDSWSAVSSMMKLARYGESRLGYKSRYLDPSTLALGLAATHDRIQCPTFHANRSENGAPERISHERYPASVGYRFFAVYKESRFCVSNGIEQFCVSDSKYFWYELVNKSSKDDDDDLFLSWIQQREALRARVASGLEDRNLEECEI